MLKIKEQQLRGGKMTEISTDAHWSSGIITIREEQPWDKEDAPAESRISWSSGGVAEGFTELEVAERMLEAWTRAVEIMRENERKVLDSQEATV